MHSIESIPRSMLATLITLTIIESLSIHPFRVTSNQYNPSVSTLIMLVVSPVLQR
jgi:hypothetical protein